MFCRNCGKEFPDSAEHCDICGHPSRISGKTNSTPSTSEYAPPSTSDYRPPPYIPPPEPTYYPYPYHPYIPPPEPTYYPTYYYPYPNYSAVSEGFVVLFIFVLPFFFFLFFALLLSY